MPGSDDHGFDDNSNQQQAEQFVTTKKVETQHTVQQEIRHYKCGWGMRVLPLLVWHMPMHGTICVYATTGMNILGWGWSSWRYALKVCNEQNIKQILTPYFIAHMCRTQFKANRVKCKCKTPSLVSKNRGRGHHSIEKKSCKLTVCHIFLPFQKQGL